MERSGERQVKEAEGETRKKKSRRVSFGSARTFTYENPEKSAPLRATTRQLYTACYNCFGTG